MFIPFFKSNPGKAIEINSDDNILFRKYLNYFSEIKEVLNKENGNFWGINLYGPILIVNPQSRTLYANEGDNTKNLTFDKGLYTGILPEEISPANTAIDWNGKRWTMLLAPIPEDKNHRNRLFVHELFHRIQPELGFGIKSQGDNKHLDQLEGRILLRLEIEALKNAVKFEKDWKTHITNAIRFRLKRYEIYPKAKKNENLLEINEGIAEYTGSSLGFNNDKELKAYFLERIEKFPNNPTFVRSFAYETIPVYGYFVCKSDKKWHRNISQQTNLTDLFIDILKISRTENSKKEISKNNNDYNSQIIRNQEEDREKRRLKLIEIYKQKFLHKSALILNSFNMNIKFDPRNIVPLEDYGTVYPSLRVVDEWGILETEKGGLINPLWNKITVSVPMFISDSTVSGDGWELQLNSDWELIKSGEKYTLKKR